MELTIKPHLTAASLQKQFSTLFPRLSLHLFKMPHGEGEGSPQSERALPDSLLSEWVGEDAFTLTVSPEMTVAELESLLRTHGIFAQVFRKSGELWLETTRTDGWSLERVNNESY
jgi:hypothetical protein